MDASGPNLIESRLKEAAADLRHLLDRGYPKSAALTLVGNRYHLESDLRHLVHRAVFSTAEARTRRSRLLAFEQLKGRRLSVDGFNVLITLESALSDRPIILADDGVVRDTAGLFSKYLLDDEPGGPSNRALSLLLDTLEEAGPEHCFIGFHQAMSRSGELAAGLRNEMNRRGIPGRAETLRSVESGLLVQGEVVATANSTLLNRAAAAFDLAGYIVFSKIKRIPQSL
ncbi:MAG: DUF434 domain-containing protein [Deltaproteobacteria bacterium]|nr:DUF434 domain-containing protein [Deltaproteobacteria bacterium]